MSGDNHWCALALFSLTIHSPVLRNLTNHSIEFDRSINTTLSVESHESQAHF